MRNLKLKPSKSANSLRKSPLKNKMSNYRVTLKYMMFNKVLVEEKEFPELEQANSFYEDELRKWKNAIKALLLIDLAENRTIRSHSG